MKAMMGVFLLVVAGLAHGESSSSLFALATGEPVRVAVTLRQRADYLAVPVILRSEKGDAGERLRALGAAKSAVLADVAKRGGWIAQEGPAMMAGRIGSKFLSSAANAIQAQAELIVLVPVTDTSDVYAASANAVSVLSQLPMPEKVELTFGNLTLAARDPQQHRTELLKRIAEDAARTRDSLAPGGVARFDGLEGPVLVRQANDHEVDLFIDYRLSVEKRP
jgi:hypothetical protein